MRSKSNISHRITSCGEVLVVDVDGFAAIVRPDDMRDLNIIMGWGLGWEHASVSPRLEATVPSYAEMCWVKDLIWGDEEAVMQLHPRKSEYVNDNPHVLHLWRPVDAAIPEPPSILVGLGRKT